MLVGEMLVRRQRMADEDGVGFLCVERAIGLVGDLEGLQIKAAGKFQRRVLGKADKLAARLMHLGIAHAVNGA
jgi:hypothetical protein